MSDSLKSRSVLFPYISPLEIYKNLDEVFFIASSMFMVPIMFVFKVPVGSFEKASG